MSKDTAETLLVLSVVILGLGIAYMIGNFFMGIELRKEIEQDAFPRICLMSLVAPGLAACASGIWFGVWNTVIEKKYGDKYGIKKNRTVYKFR